MNEANIVKGMSQIKSGAGISSEIDPSGKFMTIKFSADNSVPKFKEKRGGDFVYFGEDNLYPQQLLQLFQECSDHRAIVLGKTRFIFGNGISWEDGSQLADILKRPNLQETFEDIVSKSVLDWEIHRGFALRIRWNKLKEASRITHIPFQNIRANASGTSFKICKDWADPKKAKEAETLRSLDVSDRVEDAIFYFSAYDPSSEIYPLPEYIAATRHMEIDTHIAKFHRSNVISGWSAGTMVTLFRGEPDNDQEKRELDRRLKGAASGSAQGGEILIYFAEEGETPPEVTALRSNDLDKQYLPLGDQIQQKIFTAHGITNGMLFGIKTAGQLGGRNELLDSWELLSQGYIEPNQETLQTGFRNFLRSLGISASFNFEKVQPISKDIVELMEKGVVSKQYVQESLGLPIDQIQQSTASEKLVKTLSGMSPLLATKVLEYLSEDEIRSLASLPPKPPAPAEPPAPEIIPPAPAEPPALEPAPIPPAPEPAPGNFKLWKAIVKTASGDHFHAPIRANSLEEAQEYLQREKMMYVSLTGAEYSKQQIEDDQLQKFDPDKALALFAEFGESEDLFDILETRLFNFATDLNEKEGQILRILKDQPKSSLTEISKILWIDIPEAADLIGKLIQKKYLAPAPSSGGGLIITPTGQTEIDQLGGGTTIISTKYRYQGPRDSKNRAFCARLMDLGRVYEKDEIEKMSSALGYDVWRMRGGWYHVPGTNLNIPHCRHEWAQVIVRRKTGNG